MRGLRVVQNIRRPHFRHSAIKFYLWGIPRPASHILFWFNAVFPRLAQGICSRALWAVYMISRAWHRSYAFPRYTPVDFFHAPRPLKYFFSFSPSNASVINFSRVGSWVQAFSQLVPFTLSQPDSSLSLHLLLISYWFSSVCPDWSRLIFWCSFKEKSRQCFKRCDYRRPSQQSR